MYSRLKISLLLCLFTVQVLLCGAQHRALPAPHAKIVKTQGAESGNITCMLQDKNDHIWFTAGGEGVYRYDGKTFRQFSVRDGLCSNDISSMIENRAGELVFAGKKGICKYDGQKFSPYPSDTTVSQIAACSLFEDSKGNLWLGTLWKGTYCYDGKKLTHYPGLRTILDILQDRHGTIWFCSWNHGGVTSYDGTTFTDFVPQSPKSALIRDKMIYSVSEDRGGNLWFATRDHGAFRFDGKDFYSIWTDEGFLCDRGAYDILEDRKGRMWFSTESQGVWCYDGKSFKNYTTSDGLVHNSVFSIFEDKAGYLWFGTRMHGLSRFDGKTFTTFSE